MDLGSGNRDRGFLHYDLVRDPVRYQILSIRDVEIKTVVVPFEGPNWAEESALEGPVRVNERGQRREPAWPFNEWKNTIEGAGVTPAPFQRSAL